MWSKETGLVTQGFYSLPPDRILLSMGSYPPALQCRRLRTGEFLWERVCHGGGYSGGQVVRRNGKLFYDADTRIVAVDENDGRLLWQTTAINTQGGFLADSVTPRLFWVHEDKLYHLGDTTGLTLRGILDRALWLNPRHPDIRDWHWLKCYSLKRMAK